MRATFGKLAFAGITCLLVAGCPALVGLLGATADEQVQLRILRGMQQAVSPVTNADLNYAAQAAGEVLAIGIPTFFGTDLSAYLTPVPWPALPAANKAVYKTFLNPSDPPNEQEIALIQSQSSPLQKMSFDFDNKQPCDISLKTHNYKISLDNSRQGVTGSLAVRTTTQKAFRRKVPAATGQPYTFGRNCLTDTPYNVDVTLQLNRGSNLADVRVNLSQAPRIVTRIPTTQISVSGKVPKVDFDLSGRVTAGGISLSGTMTITDLQGNPQELQVTSCSIAGRQIQLQAEGVAQKLRIDFTYDDGKMSGTVTSTVPELPRELAHVTMQGNQALIKYLDKAQPEPWR